VGSIEFGDVTVTRVLGWQEPLVTRDLLLPGSDRGEWEANEAWLVPDFWDPGTDYAWLCAQTFVVVSGGKTILIDTGIGNGKTRPQAPPFSGLQTSFLDSLAKVARDPAR